MPLDTNIYSQLNTTPVTAGIAENLDKFTQNQQRLSQLDQEKEAFGMQKQTYQNTLLAQQEAKKEAQLQKFNLEMAGAFKGGGNPVDIEAITKKYGVPLEDVTGKVEEQRKAGKNNAVIATWFQEMALPKETAIKEIESRYSKDKKDVNTIEVGVAGRPDYRQKQEKTTGGWVNVGPSYQIGQGVANANNAKIAADERSDMGLPRPVNLPWAGISDLKAKASLQSKVYQAASKSLEATEKNVSRLDEFAQDAQRFMELNKTVETGTVIDKIPGGQWATSFGSDNSEMQKITAKVAPNMRPENSGSSSDFDAKQFERATLSVNAPKGANDAVGIIIVAKAKNEKDYYDFKKSYLEQNGTLEGAQRHWDGYQKNNTIFDKMKPGTLTLNQKRIGWQDYFASQGKRPPVQNDRPVDDKPQGKTIVKTGVSNGRKVNQYSDGSIDYAD